MQSPRKATISKGNATNCFQVLRQYEFASKRTPPKCVVVYVSNSVWEI